MIRPGRMALAQALARHWGRGGYAAAACLDEAEDLLVRARAGHRPWRQTPGPDNLMASPTCPRVTDRRDWMVSLRCAEAGVAWPFPALAGSPDPASLRGPVVFVGFHMGAIMALNAFLARLPGEVLVLRQGSADEDQGVTTIDWLALDEWGRTRATKQLADCLRGGGFVFNALDSIGPDRVEIDVLGHRTSITAGTFALARLARAPVMPIAARWRMTRLEVELGEPIAPGPAAAMAQAVGTWLGGYLQAHPRERDWPLLQAWPAPPTPARAPVGGQTG